MAEWKPFRRQADFLALPFSIFEALYGGAAGGGKSESLTALPITTRLYQHPKFKGLLLRRTFPELEKSLIVRSRDFYPHSGASYNQALRRWSWPWGAYLDFGYCEHEQDVRKYDTTEYTYVGFDEATSFTEFMYLYLTLSRVRSSDESLPAFVRAATNPGNVGHLFFRNRFVDPCPEGGKIIRAANGLKRIFIPSLPTDNPYLMKADPEYVRRLEMMPEMEKRAKLYGDWYTYEGQAFSEFRIAPLPGEPDNARHIIEPFAIPYWWPRIVAIDWGYSAWNFILWGAISPNGVLYIYREHATKKTNISVWGEEYKSLTGAEDVRTIVLDPSAWKHLGQEETLAEQIAKAIGRTPIKANNDRIAGKQLVHEFLRWKPLPILPEVETVISKETASEIIRKYGIERYHEYVDMFTNKKEEVLPRVQIFSTCKMLIETIPACIVDVDNPEDVLEFDGDDPYDDFRYLLKAVDAYVHDSKSEMERRSSLGKIYERFEVTKDQTVLHRALELRDSEEQEVTRVRMFHRGFKTGN